MTASKRLVRAHPERGGHRVMELDDILVILLAGGAGERLYPLTKDRAKPAVYFGGPYRIIDFTLSNCINSGLRRIFIATQYKSLSLSRHVRMGWSVVSEELGEFIEILPPQKRVGEHWYLGTADAVYQNLYSVEREAPRHVIVLSGDHVYKMDYAKMLRFHVEKNAAATIATIEVPIGEGSRFGIVGVDEGDRVTGFEEKPPRPTPVPGSPDVALASMGIYVFKADILMRVLERDANRPDSQHDFGKNIIPSLIKESSVFSYRFYDENKKASKYWRDIGTLDAYYEASMEALFAGIPLERVSTSMTINSTAIVLLAMYVAVAKRRGIAPSALAGTVQNDILKEYVARGTFIYPPRQSLRIVTDIMSFCAQQIPKWNSISISGYHIREAGATAVQEVAFTLANGIAYVQAALDAGINVNVLGQRLSFFFNVHNHFLEEIAKFRAARRLWARIMRDRFGATEPRAQQLRFHAQTAGSTLTAQQPDNNVARVAIQALAAVLGGTQSLHCNGRDEALGLPTQESATIALRTQQILLHESGVASTVDPLGGAYAIEEATTRIEKEAVQIIERIDSAGGTLSAIESGLIQRDIQDSAYRAQQALEHGNDVVVGVNRYTESSGHMTLAN